MPELPPSRTGTPLAEQFRRHFGHRDHLYGVLLEHLADDLDRGGPTAEICRGHLDAPRADALHLRLLAGIFRVVLRGQAPDLADFYPCLGGTGDPRDAWPVVQPVLVDHRDELRRALDLPPQTNEVGRTACLLIGLFLALGRRPYPAIRLLEVGASAGLALGVDRYRFTGRGWAWGSADSPLTLETGADGVVPRRFTVTERRGCDLAPVDVTTPDGADHLASFVWPFDLERHRRLAAAVEVTRRYPVTVDRAPASTWLAAQLDRPPSDDVLTVVWQSITEQYWSAAESQAVAATIADAAARMPVAHLAMEGVPPLQGTDGYDIARYGPTIRLNGQVIARSHHHGPPVILEPSA